MNVKPKRTHDLPTARAFSFAFEKKTGRPTDRPARKVWRATSTTSTIANRHATYDDADADDDACSLPRQA
jgi:hypothetical protein